MKRPNDIDPIDVYVGERLRQLRIAQKLSQSYLGSCVGLTFQQIQKYESGANRISASKLAWFARMLGVQVQYFFQGLPTEYHGGGRPVASPDEWAGDKDVMSRPETYKLIRLYYALRDDQQRKAIRVFLTAMAGRRPTSENIPPK